MNEDIKQEIKSAGLYQCQVARKLGMYEHAFHRLLRKKLSVEQRNAIYKAIAELKGE